MRVISYLSTVHPKVTNKEIDDLLEYVNIANNAIGVSGFLLFSEGTFFQVLEGPDEIVLGLFEKISKDTRHFSLIKMIDDYRENTSFSSYHSCFSVISNTSKAYGEIEDFLKREKKYDSKYYNNISYLIKKIISH